MRKKAVHLVLSICEALASQDETHGRTTDEEMLSTLFKPLSLIMAPLDDSALVTAEGEQKVTMPFYSAVTKRFQDALYVHLKIYTAVTCLGDCLLCVQVLIAIGLWSSRVQSIQHITSFVEASEMGAWSAGSGQGDGRPGSAALRWQTCSTLHCVPCPESRHQPFPAPQGRPCHGPGHWPA